MKFAQGSLGLHRITLVALLLGFAPTVASASSIGFTGMGRAEVVSIEGIRNVTAMAGEIGWSWTDGKPAGAATDFYSYCVDLLNNGLSSQDVTVGSTNSLSSNGTLAQNAAQKAAWLFNEYAAAVRGAFGTSAMGAGLQLAIWNVLYDGDYTLNSGTNFRVTAASAGAMYYGNLFLSRLTGSNYMLSSAMLLDARNGAGQDQMMMPPVPEPASLVLLGTGLAGMALAARRRKTKIGSPAV